ncbi:MAG: hypothetical protein KKB37_11435 [Alphaproteobacteria bacterium]|nr:hypothetical protein [Alphaproteobacteria bacterium]
MFGFDLKSAAIAGLVGIIIGGVACAAAHVAWFDPALVARTTKSVTEQVSRERDAVCAQTVTEAAQIARVAAAAHERANADAALAAFAAKAAARDREHAKQIEEFENDAKTYEAKLRAAGRACSIDINDIVWLRQHGFSAGTP